MKIKVIRNKPTKETLHHIYDVMNKNIKNPKMFYTLEETKKLKKNKNNIWLWIIFLRIVLLRVNKVS